MTLWIIFEQPFILDKHQHKSETVFGFDAVFFQISQSFGKHLYNLAKDGLLLAFYAHLYPVVRTELSYSYNFGSLMVYLIYKFDFPRLYSNKTFIFCSGLSLIVWSKFGSKIALYLRQNWSYLCMICLELSFKPNF